MKYFLILFIGVNLFAQEQVNEWTSLEGLEFAVQHPKNWTIDTSGIMGTNFILFSPLSNAEDAFKENVNFIIQDLVGYKLTLKQYTDISKNQIKTIITDSKIVSCTTEKKHNLDYQKLIYTGKQGVYNLKFTQYYWVENSKAYVLTFTSEKSKYSQYRVTGNKILNSFIIKQD